MREREKLIGEQVQECCLRKEVRFCVKTQLRNTTPFIHPCQGSGLGSPCRRRGVEGEDKDDPHFLNKTTTLQNVS